MNLTDDDRAEWAHYEAKSATAKREYMRHPIRRPHLSDHFLCLSCDVFTVQRCGICLSCQQRDPEWAALAQDPLGASTMRRARWRSPHLLKEPPTQTGERPT